MKSKEEIEKLAQITYPKESEVDEYCGFMKGYNQCQEDIRELLLEIKNNWKGDKLIGGTYEKICRAI